MEYWKLTNTQRRIRMTSLGSLTETACEMWMESKEWQLRSSSRKFVVYFFAQNLKFLINTFCVHSSLLFIAKLQKNLRWIKFYYLSFVMLLISLFLSCLLKCLTFIVIFSFRLSVLCVATSFIYLSKTTACRVTSQKRFTITLILRHSPCPYFILSACLLHTIVLLVMHTF